MRDNFNVGIGVIYIHALYWTYVTCSHVGVGDVSAVNLTEKGFATLIMLLSSFTSTYFFGNLASMVDDLAPILKTRIDKKYK